MEDVIFYSDQIEFKNYALRIASVSKNPLLSAVDIKEVRLGRRPLEVVTNTGEVLFIPTYYKKHLSLFVRVNSLSVIEREDVWSLLNEPFLDTEFEEKHKQQTIKILHNSGFSLEETSMLRKKISARMLAYNAVLWDWTHLGYYDVLAAFGYNARIQIFRKRAKIRYDEFNVISNRGRVIDPVTTAIGERVKNSIGELVYDIIPFSMDELASKKLNKSDVRESLRRKLIGLIMLSYHQAHRHYHTLEHILSVVEYCESLCAKEEKNSYIPLRLAALFHDIVYDPTSDKNEESSAELMCSTLEKWVDSKDLYAARSLILITRSHLEAKSHYEKILSDADLSILAEEESIYKRYLKALRQEYLHIDDVTFNARRLEFLEIILEYVEHTGHLFYYLHPLHESQALKNITEERKKIIQASVK